jgi:WD40 repeat protein
MNDLSPGAAALPLALKCHLELVCDRFETAWKAGDRPTIEAYLADVTEPLLSVLLRELLLLDADYRRRRHEDIPPADYAARFPQVPAGWLETALAPPARADGATPTSDPAASQTVRLAPPPAAGTRLGDYELLEVLGRGGMGVVWKARQLGANRLVAVKLILAAELAGEADVRRFCAEAEIAAGLDHPNLVPLYEVGEDQGRHFFSMKLIQGGHLGQHLCHYQDRPCEAAALLRTVAQAVHHAHQHGLLHRDLKPGNILLDAQGQPHVTDFGLARRLAAPGSLSQSGQVVGTPEYMAPEQARGQKALTTAADVYGLGAVLYALLTGRPPFVGPSVLGTLEQVVGSEPVAPRVHNRRVPRDLETICLKCLRKEPAQRYGSAADLAEELRRFLAGEPISAKAVGPGERLLLWARRRPALAAVHGLLLLVVVLGGLGGGALWLWQQTEEARRQAEDALREKAAAQETLDQVLYLRNVDLAYREWQAGGIALAEQLLERCPPSRRHWEWYYLHHLGQGEILTVPGTRNGTWGLAYSPDGTLLASAFGGLEVPVWDARTGRRVFTLEGSPGPVYKVAFSPDGSRVAAGGGSPGTTLHVSIWDVRTGKQLLVLKGDENMARGLAFSPDSKRLAAGGERNTTWVWDTDTGRETLVLQGLTREGRPGPARAVAFSPDGKRLASTSSGWIHVWDAESGKEVLTLEGPNRLFSAVAFSPDGTRLAAGGNGKEVLVWDARTGQQALVLEGHTSDVTGVAFSPDGTRLATASLDHTVRVWYADTGEEAFCFRRHPTQVHCLAFSPDGTRLASGGLETKARVWEAVPGPGPLVLKGHTARVTDVAFGSDGVHLASSSLDGTLRTWDALTGQARLTFKGHSGAVLGIAFDPQAARLASAGEDQTVRLWDTATGKELRTFRGHTDEVLSVAFSPDGRHLASAGNDRTVRLWEADMTGEIPGRLGKEVRMLRGHTAQVSSVTFSPDGTRLASAGFDRTARVWDAQTGAEVFNLQGGGRPVVCVAFSPDGTHLAAGCWDSAVRIWEVATGREIRRLPGHQSVHRVAFSPDGRRLAGILAGVVRLWDTQLGEQALTLDSGPKELTSVAFSPAGLPAFSAQRDNPRALGRRLAAGCADGVVRVWDASPQGE